MNNVILKNIIRFILLILLQVWVLDKVSFDGFIIPYVYVLFVLLLPLNINKSLLLLIAFGTGLTIDFFENTLGLHAAALVLLAFFRPGIIHLFFPRLEFVSGEEPGIIKLGLGGFLKYSFSLVFIFQLVIVFLETFSFRHFLTSLWYVVLGTLVTVVFIVVTDLIFLPSKNKIRKR